MKRIIMTMMMYTSHFLLVSCKNFNRERAWPLYFLLLSIPSRNYFLLFSIPSKNYFVYYFLFQPEITLIRQSSKALMMGLLKTIQNNFGLFIHISTSSDPPCPLFFSKYKIQCFDKNQYGRWDSVIYVCPFFCALIQVICHYITIIFYTSIH